MAERVDLDELARLEEERDFLLRSIEDLDREHDAGDVDDEDYDELRRGYVARAAEAIRAVDAGTAAVAEQRRAGAPGSRTRTLVWSGAVVVFTVVAGVLLANALGSRSPGSTVTGSGAMPGGESDRCRQLTFSKPAEGIECYDKVLADKPDDVDALTYQGWAKVRSGDPAGGSKLFDRVVEIDPTFPDVHVFRASVAKTAGDFVTAQAELDRMYELNPSPLVISTLQQMGLDKEVAVGLLPADVKECWTKEESALAALATASAAEEADRSQLVSAVADVTSAVKCFDGVVAVRPADADALTLRSLGIGVLGLVGLMEDNTYPRAAADADAALAARPGDPSALVLRAAWNDKLGRLDAAEADLAAIGDRRISPLVAAYFPVSDVKAAIAADRAAAAVTTTAPTTTTAP